MNSLDNEGEDIGVLAESWLGWNTEVLLFVFASDGVLVTEDKVQLRHDTSQHICCVGVSTTHLVTRAGQVRTEHDNPRGRVREFLATRLEAVLEQLDVTTTAVSTLLVLYLVLNHEGLFFEVDRGCKRGRDGVVCSLGLCNETLLANDERCLRVLDLPLANVGKGLAAYGGLFGGLGGRPTFGPILCELFDEWGSDFSGLKER